jgi:hypothetical protein
VEEILALFQRELLAGDLVCVQGISCLKPGQTIDGGGATDARPATEGGAWTKLTSTDQFLDCPLANGGTETCPKATKACCPGTGCVDCGIGQCVETAVVANGISFVVSACK